MAMPPALVLLWKQFLAVLSGRVVRAGTGCAVSSGITEDVLHVQNLLLSKAQGGVSTLFLSKLVALLPSSFIALSFVPCLQLLFATILKTNLASLAFFELSGW